MMKIMGIDVGLNGGIAFWDGKEMTVIPTPTYFIDPKKSQKKDYDMKKIRDFFIECSPDMIILEKQHAFPAQGVVSMFSLGKGFGYYLGLISGLQISNLIIDPKTWQKSFGIIGGDTKLKSFNVAKGLFPKIDFISKKNKIYDGLCDAVLITEFGKGFFNEKI